MACYDLKPVFHREIVDAATFCRVANTRKSISQEPNELMEFKLLSTLDGTIGHVFAS